MLDLNIDNDEMSVSFQIKLTLVDKIFNINTINNLLLGI